MATFGNPIVASPNLLPSTAEVFNASKSGGYGAGEYVYHEGKLYTFTAAHTGAWTGTDVEAVKLADEVAQLKSEIDEFDDMFIPVVNLFNPDDPDMALNVELKNDGTTATKAGFFASGYIPVVSGGTLCAHYPTGTYGSASSMVTYDENKARTGYVTPERLTDANGRGYLRYTFGNPALAKFVRMTGSLSTAPVCMYVYAAEMPSTYTPYRPKTLLDANVDYSDLLNVSVSKEDTDFVKSAPKNLCNLSQFEVGIISNSNNNGNLNDSVTNWRTSGFIPVEPGKTYSLYSSQGVYYGANNVGIALYNEYKMFIARKKPAGGTYGNQRFDTLTIPEGMARYIRLSYPKANIEEHPKWFYTMVVEGTTEWDGNAAYIPYDPTVNVQGAGISGEFAGNLDPLANKVSVWDGDSIMAADNDPGGGFPLRIAAIHRMRAKSYAVAGGTIAENVGSAHSVCATLDTMLASFPNADYIIIDGGTNDADILGSAGLGTFDADDFSDEYIEALDKNTFCGALESIFFRLVTIMKGKHIGYIIPQKMGYTAVLVERRRQFFDKAIEICGKWGVPYLDLWNNYYFNWELAAHWDQTMTPAENNEANNLYKDGQHLTNKGYEILSPVIGEWMKTL